MTSRGGTHLSAIMSSAVMPAPQRLRPILLRRLANGQARTLRNPRRRQISAPRCGVKPAQTLAANIRSPASVLVPDEQRLDRLVARLVATDHD